MGLHIPHEHITEVIYTEGLCPVCNNEMTFVGIIENDKFWICKTCNEAWIQTNLSGHKTILKNLKDIQNKLIFNDIAK